jgi:magnesium-transporting ATPase (P-type)
MAMAEAAAPLGLSEEEAGRRLAAKPAAKDTSSRSYWSIVRSNVFTFFNLILLFFGVLTLAFGKAPDAFFLVILVLNSGIGIAQEVRAKRTLDRLSALVAPTAAVVRDGTTRHVAVDEVVEGDLVEIRAGDQVVADGTLERSDSLLVDESILTGESAHVTRAVGEEVRSGSFATEGAGAYRVTAVGEGSYASRLAGEARTFRHPRSPLERALNRLLLILTFVLIPLGSALGYTLWRRDTPLHTAVPTTVAAVVTLIPEGLILLTSVTYAVAARRMARAGALAQQLNAIESLASVDVVCLDKTGTLTDATLRVIDLEPAPWVSRDELARALGRFAASTPAPNATLVAIGEAHPAEADEVVEQVPFSSRRRWSGLRFEDDGFALGAPELFRLDGLAERAEEEARQGRRVLAFGRSASELNGSDELPANLETLGLVVLAEQLRPDARETVEFFLSQGVDLKVISGDRPETVAAIAADAGIPANGPPLDGRELPESAAVLRSASVIGRISPEGKQRMIRTLTEAGHYVAMVGDGVNDVPALKASRLAIAQGSGAQMAKSVSDLVLVHGDFGVVPKLVGEGRNVLRNLQRVAKLFVTKSAFAVFLILSVGLTPTAYPLLPRHLSLAAALTLGIPAFFLALAPSQGRYDVQGFLFDTARFAVPAGTSAGLGVLSSYLFALNVAQVSLGEARTIAVTVLVIVGLYLVLALEASGRRRSAAVSTLVGGMFALYLIVLALPATRSFFDLHVPGPGGWFIVLVGSTIAIGGLWLTDDRFVPRWTAGEGLATGGDGPAAEAHAEARDVVEPDQVVEVVEGDGADGLREGEASETQETLLDGSGGGEERAERAEDDPELERT